MLSRVHSLLWWQYYDRTPDRVALAKAAVDRAVVLQPESPDVHAALGYYYYWCHLDYDRALTEFAVVLKGRPSDSDVLLGTGFVLRRQGKFREAVATLTKAAELEPQHATRWLNLGETSALIWDFAQAERSLDRSIALTPAWARPYGLKGRYALRLAGDVARARVPLFRAASLTLREDPDVAYANIVLALFSRDYQAADLPFTYRSTHSRRRGGVPAHHVSGSGEGCQ